MNFQERLREAQYVIRGKNGEYLEGIGQCGFLPCDHSRVVENDFETYRFCEKLNMRVADYDSCRYHSQEKMNGLLYRWVELSLEEQGQLKPNQKRTNSHYEKVRERASADARSGGTGKIILITAGVIIFLFIIANLL